MSKLIDIIKSIYTKSSSVVTHKIIHISLFEGHMKIFHKYLTLNHHDKENNK